MCFVKILSKNLRKGCFGKSRNIVLTRPFSMANNFAKLLSNGPIYSKLYIAKLTE